MTPAVRSALEKRYQAPEWALLFEVPSGLGRAYGRSADALAMNLFESRGFRVEGVEIKVSRGDWLRELRDPEKSIPVQRYCDHWWIATPPDLVFEGELPPTWGLLELKGGCLRVKVKAPKLSPVPLDANFVAGMVRRANQKAEAELEKRVREATQEARAKVDEEVARRVKDRTREVDRRLDQIAHIERICGPIGEWEGGEEIASAIQAVRNAELFGSWKGLSTLAEDMKRLGSRIETLCRAAASDSESEAA
jgi:hypothetical protein